jgi:MoaA/NifB/PqqE/SkfB family radical SAM enzyme
MHIFDSTRFPYGILNLKNCFSATKLKMIDAKLLNKFNEVRISKAKAKLCHAPFVSINFEQNGNMRACCYNSSEILGMYPIDSVEHAWFGEKANELRQYILNNSLEGGCQSCKEQLYAHNFQGSKIVPYDIYATKKNPLKLLFQRNEVLDWPKVFEFEISNTCNLECIMCNGYFSSAIRANREKLPKLESPYDDQFVEQIKPFLPHLTDLKFLGGEPFLIDLYYKIWDEIISNSIKGNIHITTNGTVLTSKAKRYLDKINASLIISIDSLEKNTAERIRKNLKYEALIENINWFIEYSKNTKNLLTFAVCPMMSNYHELADIVKFCNKNQILIHFNTVWSPEEETLKNLSNEQLSCLLKNFQEISFDKTTVGKHNQNKVNDLIHHLHYWQTEKDERNSIYLNILKTIATVLPTLKEKEQTFLNLVTESFNSVQEKYSSQRRTLTKSNLKKLNDEWGNEIYLSTYINCLEVIANFEEQLEPSPELNQKFNALKKVLGNEVSTNNFVKSLEASDFFDAYIYLKNESLKRILSIMNQLK